MNHDAPDKCLCPSCVRKQKEEAARVDYASPCPECGQSDCPCWHRKLDKVAAQLWPPKLQSCPQCGDHPVTRGSMGEGVKVVCPKGCRSTLWCNDAVSAAKQWNDLITLSPAPARRVHLYWKDGTTCSYPDRQAAAEAFIKVGKEVTHVFEDNDSGGWTRMCFRWKPQMVKEDEP